MFADGESGQFGFLTVRKITHRAMNDNRDRSVGKPVGNRFDCPTDAFFRKKSDRAVREREVRVFDHIVSSRWIALGDQVREMGLGIVDVLGRYFLRVSMKIPVQIHPTCGQCGQHNKRDRRISRVGSVFRYVQNFRENASDQEKEQGRYTRQTWEKRGVDR